MAATSRAWGLGGALSMLPLSPRRLRKQLKKGYNWYVGYYALLAAQLEVKRISTRPWLVEAWQNAQENTHSKKLYSLFLDHHCVKLTEEF